MTKVEKLEKEVQNLSPDELATFREWFQKFDSDDWDRQIKEDIESGKLYNIAQEAVAAHKAINAAYADGPDTNEKALQKHMHRKQRKIVEG
jgi:hypothetical protein